MNLVAFVLSPPNAGARDPNDERLWEQPGLSSTRTTAGEPVTPAGALKVSAVFACVRNIAEDISKLPLVTYERLQPEGKRRASEQAIYHLLHGRPNPEMGSLDFRQAVSACAILLGNGYAEIERSTDGQAVALWPLESWRVTPCRDAMGRLYYSYATPGSNTTIPLPAADVLHIKGFSTDGVAGEMVSKLGAESIGLAKAAEKFAASFFGNGAHAGVILRHPGKLSDDAKKRLKESWNNVHRGAGQAHGTAVLEEAMEVEKVTVDPEQSQALEMRQFQIEDLCRWFRMPPHKVQQLLRSTFGNIEHQSIEYVTDTLLTWIVRWEQEINEKIVRVAGPDFFCEHLVDMLLRGDALSRAQALQVQLMHGVLTPDEWRALENRNPLPGGWGKKHFMPVNLRPIDSAPPAAPAPPTGASTASARAASGGPGIDVVKKATARLFAAAVGRAIAKEVNAAQRHRRDLAAFAPEFYRTHASHMREMLDDPAMALVDLMLAIQTDGTLPSEAHKRAAAILEAYVNEHVAASQADLRQTKPEQLDAILSRWTVERPPAAAHLLSDRIAQAITTQTPEGASR